MDKLTIVQIESLRITSILSNGFESELSKGPIAKTLLLELLRLLHPTLQGGFNKNVIRQVLQTGQPHSTTRKFDESFELSDGYIALPHVCNSSELLLIWRQFPYDSLDNEGNHPPSSQQKLAKRVNLSAHPPSQIDFSSERLTLTFAHVATKWNTIMLRVFITNNSESRFLLKGDLTTVVNHGIKPMLDKLLATDLNTLQYKYVPFLIFSACVCDLLDRSYDPHIPLAELYIKALVTTAQQMLRKINSSSPPIGGLNNFTYMLKFIDSCNEAANHVLSHHSDHLSLRTSSVDVEPATLKEAVSQTCQDPNCPIRILSNNESPYYEASLLQTIVMAAPITRKFTGLDQSRFLSISTVMFDTLKLISTISWETLSPTLSTPRNSNFLGIDALAASIKGVFPPSSEMNGFPRSSSDPLSLAHSDSTRNSIYYSRSNAPNFPLK